LFSITLLSWACATFRLVFGVQGRVLLRRAVQRDACGAIPLPVISWL
jgi:hypothetical protein